MVRTDGFLQRLSNFDNLEPLKLRFPIDYRKLSFIEEAYSLEED